MLFSSGADENLDRAQHKFLHPQNYGYGCALMVRSRCIVSAHITQLKKGHAAYMQSALLSTSEKELRNNNRAISAHLWHITNNLERLDHGESLDG